MPEHHAASDFVALFPADDIPGIIQNVQDCCSKLSRETPFELENDLTKRLFKHLCRCLEYRTGPLEPVWEANVVSFDEDEPEVTGRVDIRFSCGRGIETYFPVEAKRLFVTYPKGSKASLVTNYINDGMMRYVSGQYASKMTVGAMLGYVCDSTLSKARTALDSETAKQSGNLQLTEDGFWQTSAIATTPSIDETRHDFNGRDFTMYHILTKV